MIVRSVSLCKIWKITKHTQPLLGGHSIDINFFFLGHAAQLISSLPDQGLNLGRWL